MSFFRRLFRSARKKPPVPASPKGEKAEIRRNAPGAGVGDALSEMRFRARTGDPGIATHHSGSFGDPGGEPPAKP